MIIASVIIAIATQFSASTYPQRHKFSIACRFHKTRGLTATSSPDITVSSHSMQGPSTTQGNPFKDTAPVIGVPVDQTSSTPTANAQNTLPVISDGFCVPHDVVFTLQANLNPRSTEIYNVIDSAGTGQFR